MKLSKSFIIGTLKHRLIDLTKPRVTDTAADALYNQALEDFIANVAPTMTAKQLMAVKDLLNRHGSYSYNAAYLQGARDVMRGGSNSRGLQSRVRKHYGEVK